MPPEYPHSLFKGHMGLAVLAADLERPEAARMPFFEPRDIVRDLRGALIRAVSGADRFRHRVHREGWPNWLGQFKSAVS